MLQVWRPRFGIWASRSRFVVMYAFFTAVTIRERKPSLGSGINGAWPSPPSLSSFSAARLGLQMWPDPASLVHTGRPLTATPAIQFRFVVALVSAIARIVAAFSFFREPMLPATGWVLAFGCFVFVFAPLLLKPRK
jgi:hypothetical protein